MNDLMAVFRATPRRFRPAEIHTGRDTSGLITTRKKFPPFGMWPLLVLSLCPAMLKI